MPLESFEPKKVEEYARREYWNERFEKEDEFDWLGKYDNFKHYCTLNNEAIDKASIRVLVLGCGNSTLSYDMYKDGFHNVTSVDYSDIVIEKMQQRYPELTWVVQDVTNMSDFQNESFDLVIDKGVQDALVADERDPWDPDKQVVARVHKMLREVYRVLRQGGRFLQVSFAQPHFRRNYLIPPLPQTVIETRGEADLDKFYVLNNRELYELCSAGQNLFGWHYCTHTLPDVGFGYFVYLLDKL